MASWTITIVEDIDTAQNTVEFYWIIKDTSNTPSKMSLVRDQGTLPKIRFTDQITLDLTSSLTQFEVFGVELTSKKLVVTLNTSSTTNDQRVLTGCLDDGNGTDTTGSLSKASRKAPRANPLRKKSKATKS